MTNLNKKTKAEIIEMLEIQAKELEELRKKEEERETQIKLDLSFGATPKERNIHAEKQKKKDQMLRATNWRFTSEKSKDDFENQMRLKGLIR